MAAVTVGAGSLSRAGSNMQGDREVVMAAVQRQGENFWHASRELQNDRAVVLAAVSSSPYCMRGVAPQFRNDPEIITAVIENRGTLDCVPDELRSDRAVVMSFVKRHGTDLLYAAPELKNDRGIAKAAVRQDANAFGLLSDNLKSDIDLLVLALRHMRQGDLGQRHNFMVVFNMHHRERIVWILGQAVKRVNRYQGIPGLDYRDLASIVRFHLAHGRDWEGVGYIYYVERGWKHFLYEQVWIIQKMMCGNEGDLHQLICDFAGIPLEVELANEIVRKAPFLVALTIRKIVSLSELNSYLI